MNVRETLRAGGLLCDGAMGTMLHAAGNTLDQALPALNLTRPDLVRTIHARYVEANVDIIQTNTFAGGRLRLDQYGLGHQVEEINRAAVVIARDAAATVGEARKVLVAGAVSPAVTVHQRRRVSPADRAASVREQIEVLSDAGVDFVLLETFGYLDELVEAVHAAAEGTDLPLVAQATFNANLTMLSGHTPREVAAAMADLPVTAFGTNCTLGPQRSLAVVRELREHTDLPLTVQANAGLPRRVAASGRFEYDVDYEYFNRYAASAMELGVSVVGGCCGTTPAHLAAIVGDLDHGGAGHDETTALPPTAPLTDPVVTERPTETATPAPFAAAGPVVGVELRPEHIGEVDAALTVARDLSDAGAHLVTVAAARSNRAHVNSADLALHLSQHLGVDTAASVATWDRTIMALQADLLGAHALGLRRIVCETGTPPLLGDYPHVDGIWDVDSVGLIELLAGLNRGVDFYDLRLPAKTEFEIGARTNPGSREPEEEHRRTLEKIGAGAQFLITRPVYELEGLGRLLRTVDGRVPVFVALRPLVSFEEAEFFAHEVPDVVVPRRTLDLLGEAKESAPQVGLDLMAELAAEIKKMADGVVVTQSKDPVTTLHRVLSA
ncbi:bifunctional homocysteine S-methyltransferase/methylenetetrahydrofolate reductase [Spiractinospora alimapuensis]|uniref:bifunctional homocysteine S-methyltransferase/methylenetetrahydrofolate reductase n=1 Tax=Spiractinospora alimapuensis TaxID=2820884 RepID=UPI001F29C6CA|nr:bifunctional homocysteine S-methyltransferase/methylenetetrahydrofolate reductase [Spiractinospora alimapuensis]QVQ53673.1 bifunctional homocysteine S-methyltransferase/methylenetetrahydrofolate reductase [Spiractinospora alimapuensis]